MCPLDLAVEIMREPWPQHFEGRGKSTSGRLVRNVGDTDLMVSVGCSFRKLGCNGGCYTYEVIMFQNQLNMHQLR